MSSSQPGDAIRLNIIKAFDHGKNHRAVLPFFHEIGVLHPGRHTLSKQQLASEVGDVVLGRKDGRGDRLSFGGRFG